MGPDYRRFDYDRDSGFPTPLPSPGPSFLSQHDSTGGTFPVTVNQLLVSVGLRWSFLLPSGSNLSDYNEKTEEEDDDDEDKGKEDDPEE